MLNISSKVKEVLEQKISDTRVLLNLQDGFLTSFYVISGDKITETSVDLSSMHNDELKELMKVACKGPEVDAAFLLINAFTKSYAIKDKDLIPKSIEHEEDKIPTVVAFLYTRDSMFLRNLPYKRRNAGDYWFGDQGWEKVPDVAGRFANPFEK